MLLVSGVSWLSQTTFLGEGVEGNILQEKRRSLYDYIRTDIYIYKPGTLNNYFFKWLFSWMIPKLYFWEVIVSPNHFEVDASGTSNDIYIYKSLSPTPTSSFILVEVAVIMRRYYSSTIYTVNT